MPEISLLPCPKLGKIFFSRKDPNDPRLGEIVARNAGDYAAAEIVILGCPQDEGVRRIGGRGRGRRRAERDT